MLALRTEPQIRGHRCSLLALRTEPLPSLRTVPQIRGHWCSLLALRTEPVAVAADGAADPRSRVLCVKAVGDLR